MQTQLIKVYFYNMCAMAWMNAILRTMHIQTVAIVITIFPICSLLHNYFNVHCYSPVFRFDNSFKVSYHNELDLSSCKSTQYVSVQ